MLVGMFIHMKAAWFFLHLECSARHSMDFRYGSVLCTSFFPFSFSTIRYLYHIGFVIYFVSIKDISLLFRKECRYLNSPYHDPSVSIQILSDSFPVLIHLTDSKTSLVRFHLQILYAYQGLRWLWPNLRQIVSPFQQLKTSSLSLCMYQLFSSSTLDLCNLHSCLLKVFLMINHSYGRIYCLQVDRVAMLLHSYRLYRDAVIQQVGFCSNFLLTL